MPPEALGSGILLGLSAGLAPGPLFTLVVSETLRHGAASGIRVAMAPLITDLPIIAVTLLLVVELSGFREIGAILSLVGAGFILYLAVDTLRAGEGTAAEPADRTRPRSLLRGVLVNALSPHPYLFWLGIGGPLMLRASRHGLLGPVLFVGGFYLCLVGSKVALAVLVGRSRRFLEGRAYRSTLRLLALLLVLLALGLIRDAVTTLT
ncbi:MAG: LysE family translocator [Gammaproteobacteria bacterium]|nr:MAG: LysE family translocator [Gammaproteobacteria bacterium]